MYAEAKTSQTRLLPGCKIQPIQIGHGFYLGVFLRAGESTLQQLGRQRRRGFAAYSQGWGVGSRKGGARVTLLLPIALSRWAGCYLPQRGQGEGAVAPAWLLFSGL